MRNSRAARNAVRIQITILSALALVLIFGLAFGARGASADPFLQYEATDGSLAFTDDPATIPAVHKGTETLRDFDELDTGKTTPHNTSAVLPEPHVVEMPATNPNHLNDCTGSVEILEDRIQTDEFNSKVFIVKDECGRTVSVTPFYPDVNILR